MTVQQAKSEYRNEQLRLRAKTYLQYMFSLVYISVPPIPITLTSALPHIQYLRTNSPPSSYNSLQHHHICIRTYWSYIQIRSPQDVKLTSAAIYTYTVRQGQTPIQSSSSLRSKNDVKLTSAYAHIQYGRAIPHYLVSFVAKSKKQPSKTYARITYTRPGINCRRRYSGPKTGKVVTSTTGPPGPHWPI